MKVYVSVRKVINYKIYCRILPSLALNNMYVFDRDAIKRFCKSWQSVGECHLSKKSGPTHKRN